MELHNLNIHPIWITIWFTTWFTTRFKPSFYPILYLYFISYTPTTIHVVFPILLSTFIEIDYIVPTHFTFFVSTELPVFLLLFQPSPSLPVLFYQGDLINAYNFTCMFILSFTFLYFLTFSSYNY